MSATDSSRISMDMCLCLPLTGAPAPQDVGGLLPQDLEVRCDEISSARDSAK